ncbi:MAG: GNAT family N-acetyltransferase, partial [Candidatus Aadella gelida]|nr:GNAT family N-acetyltransferase [Candidatus Aadella gelida]
MRILNIKIISITLIATLLFQSASWASAPDQEKQKIQVPSAFNQITNNTNWQYDEQVRIEVALILAIKPNTPFHVINDNIDRMYEGTRKKRIVDVIPPAGVEAKNKDRQVKFLYGHRKGEILDLSITGQDKKGEQKQEKFSERTEEYDDQGNLTKIYDKETGRIWEKYERDEGGQINEVLLYNPRSGKRLELMRDPMFGKNEEDEHDRSVRWIIFYENENREEDWIGGVTTNENEERIELKDITIRFDEERGEGNGKTIMRWLALTAHRKQKELKIAEIHNPATTGIAKELYLQETLRVTQEKNIIPFSGNKELDAILLEQEYYFMTLMEDGLAPERRHVTIGKGTGNILLGDEWPAEYKAFVDKDRLIVKDKKGKNVRLTYSKLLYLIGKPDKNNIIRLQQEEEIERENKKETDIPGRKTEYGDQGRVRKIYDDKTGITWEEYTYDEGGITKTITLYNPALGGTIKIEKDPLYSDKKDTNEGPSRWYIKNTEKGKEDEKIGSIAIMRSNEKIMILNIRIYEEEDKGKGLGKTILRWIAVSAHRENKILKVSTTTSPIAAAISLTLF